MNQRGFKNVSMLHKPNRTKISLRNSLKCHSYLLVVVIKDNSEAVADEGKRGDDLFNFFQLLFGPVTLRRVRPSHRYVGEQTGNCHLSTLTTLIFFEPGELFLFLDSIEQALTLQVF